MNPYLIVSIVLAVIVAALVIYIIADRIKRRKELDELIDFLTKVQDRDTFPELGLEAEGRMLILRSEIYKLASTLQEQYAGEVKKNTYKADMLSNISHQIKTPLTAINLMTDALKNGNMDEAQRRRCISNIEAQTDHITWLVRTLLTLAEIDAGVLVMKKEAVKLRGMIDEIVSSIAIEADIKDVSIDINISPDIEIVCDRRWTLEALSNIIKNSLHRWVLDRLKNYHNLETGSDNLVLEDLNPEDIEAGDIRDSAVLALKNTGVYDPKEICLSGIRDRKRIIAAGLSNGDGVIPVSLLTDEKMIPCASMVARLFGTVPDASGLEGFNQDALKKFKTAAEAYVAWHDAADQSAAILPFGADTKKVYDAFSAVREALDQYYDLCGALRMFGEKNIAPAAPGNLMDTAEVENALKKAPAAAPAASCIFSRKSELNPVWHDRIMAFFDVVLPGKETISEEEWVALKKKFCDFETWLTAKPSDLFDKEDLGIIRAALKDDIPGELQKLIDRDLAYSKEISGFDNVEKLILYQANLVKLLNNYVNLRVLFNPSIDSILQAGILVMDGRCFKLAIRVTNVAEHKKIAERSNICIMYIDAQTGKADALKKMQLAVAVTHGDMYNLFIGKCGVFFTADGTVWDAKVTDFIQQPVSISEAIRMPFFRFGNFLGRQMDKFFSARSKEFETGFDKTVTQAQTFKPAAPAPKAPQQTPAVSGSMMLMGGGIGLAAIGSSVAFIAQSLKNVSFWNVLAVFLIILLIFGGPLVVVSLVKLYRRDIAVYLEASGLALNKRMRLNRFMSKIFTERPEIPRGKLLDTNDVIRIIFRKEQEQQEQPVSAFRKVLGFIFWLIAVAAFGMVAGITLWQYLSR